MRLGELAAQLEQYDEYSRAPAGGECPVWRGFRLVLLGWISPEAYVHVYEAPRAIAWRAQLRMLRRDPAIFDGGDAAARRVAVDEMCAFAHNACGLATPDGSAAPQPAARTQRRYDGPRHRRRR